MADTAEGYSLLASCTIGGVPALKYRSSRTGITVCIAQVEGPIVNGFFCLATEAHDDDGLPHTLEHLVFMGSEKYPYKGVLDLLANRCLAQGTNAWTDIDHTCYTVTTAGHQGFLNLLPIYLDHILYPTLTDAAYLTEVHHINGEGDDAGVVYCEMQARENTSEDMTHHQLCQLMYPGDCGYKSETGGRLLNLRQSTSNEKVRSYHKSYYRPDNLSLIVTGQVTAKQVFAALAPFEDKIISKGKLPHMERPWQGGVDPVTGTEQRNVPFPTSEEDDGIVRVGWRGPPAKDRYTMTAMEVLFEYLTDTPVAPLQRELVEVGEPYCSDVEVLQLENKMSVFGVTLQGVPTDLIGQTDEKVMSVLKGFSTGSEQVDMTRINNLLKQSIVKINEKVESSPHYFFAFSFIGDFLFGDTPEDFVSYMDQLPNFKQLLKEPCSFWTNLIDKYLVQAYKTTVCGCPSKDLATKMAEEEQERVKKQRDSLGEQGLKQKEQALKEAITANEVPAPTDMISSLNVPTTDTISFHTVKVETNDKGGVANDKGGVVNSRLDVTKLPFFCQLNQINSNFIRMTAVLNTANLPRNLKVYVALLSELLFESAIKRDGDITSYETVVKQLEADLIDYSASVGMRGARFLPAQIPEGFSVTIKVETSKYSLGVKWLYDVLYNIHLAADRVGVVTNKIMNDVNRMKREGAYVTKMVLNHTVYNEESNYNLCNMVTQDKFLSTLQEDMKDPSKARIVLESLEQLRDEITKPSNLRVFVSGDVTTVTGDPAHPWTPFPHLPCNISPATMEPVPSSPANSSPGKRTLIAGVGGVESNYLSQCVPCIKGYAHPDLPAIMVFMECLGALEGPMWRQIRGMGLSYHYRLYCNPEDGLLFFVLFKSSQLVQAYSVAKEIVLNYVSGHDKFGDVEIESAKSCVIYEIIAREKTPGAAARQATLSHFRSVPLDYNRKFLEAISMVTASDINRVANKYFIQLFDPAHFSCAVCCNSNKVTETQEGLEGLGHKVSVVKDMESLAVFI